MACGTTVRLLLVKSKGEWQKMKCLTHERNSLFRRNCKCSDSVGLSPTKQKLPKLAREGWWVSRRTAESK